MRLIFTRLKQASHRSWKTAEQQANIKRKHDKDQRTQLSYAMMPTKIKRQQISTAMMPTKRKNKDNKSRKLIILLITEIGIDRVPADKLADDPRSVCNTIKGEQQYQQHCGHPIVWVSLCAISPRTSGLDQARTTHLSVLLCLKTNAYFLFLRFFCAKRQTRHFFSVKNITGQPSMGITSSETFSLYLQGVSILDTLWTTRKTTCHC
jgi:hypothetical protein